jgi:hypothetical protein
MQGGFMRRKLLLGVGLATLIAGPGAGVARADFVCPVLPISEKGAENAGHFAPLGTGEYTILPGRAGDAAESPVSPPDHATNSDGTGSPGNHASPGDPGYTPIWNTP